MHDHDDLTDHSLDVGWLELVVWTLAAAAAVGASYLWPMGFAA